MRSTLSLLVALVLSPVVAGQPQLTALTNVAVVDVVAGTAVPAQTVVLDGAAIAAVVPAASFEPAEGTTLVDGTGKFLVPGFFDAHVHYVDPDSYGPLMIAHGVLFVRDMGNATDVIVPLRDRLGRGEVLGPEMACTGAIVDGDPPVWPFSEPCGTPEEARAAVRKLHAAGVDQIKVYSRLKPDVYRAAVAEARAVGLRAVGHVPNECTLDDAIAAGQASNEHMMMVEKLIAKAVPPGTPIEEDRSQGIWPSGRFWFLYPQADEAVLAQELEVLAASGMMQCPTLVVSAGIAAAVDRKGAADPRMAYVPASLRAFWEGDQYQGFGRFMERALPHMKSMVGEMHAAGAPIMVGTDLANPYVFAGSSVHDEMRMLTEAGLTTAEALRAATIVPARFLGVDQRLGTVEAGKTASVVLLTANPLESIGNTTRIDSVWLRGERYDRAALDALLEGVREAIAPTLPAASAQIVLDLPGEVLLRGTYKVRFGLFDAGTEDVLLTKTAEGYAVMAHNEPQGGPQAPSVITWHTGPDFGFRSATYRQLTKTPTEATYRLAEGELVGAAAEEGRAIGESSVAVSAGDLISAPTFAADFFTVNALGLEPGGTWKGDAHSFGYPDWRPQSAPLEVTRLEDALLARPNGTSVPARHYEQVLTTPMGAFSSETWTDERGVVLRSVMTMPFGQLTVELEP